MNTTAHFHSFCTQKSILTWIPLKSAGSSELYAKRIPADFWIYAKTGALTFFEKTKHSSYLDKASVKKLSRG